MENKNESLESEIDFVDNSADRQPTRSRVGKWESSVSFESKSSEADGPKAIDLVGMRVRIWPQNELVSIFFAFFP